MAMIQKIRDNSALTLIVIGGAIFAFILTDYLSSQGGGTEIDNMVGSFEGYEISDSEFNSERRKQVFLRNGGEDFNSIQDFQKGQYTNLTWNEMLKDKFFQNECEDLGVLLTPEEEDEMLLGDRKNDIEPSFFFVKYLFGGKELYDQNYGQISQNLSNLGKFAYMAVNDQQGQIGRKIPLGARNAEWVKDFGFKLRTQDKYNRLLNSCFYATTSLAKDEYIASKSVKDVEIAFVKYNAINDEDLEPTEAEKEAAYNELKPSFVEKEASRKVLFARFDLNPSNEDKNAVYKDIASLKQSLSEEEEAKLFIKNETEGIVNYSYFKKGEYPVKLGGVDTLLFGQPKGYTFGPFSNPEGTQFGVAKVLETKTLADSAKVKISLVSFIPAKLRVVSDSLAQIETPEQQQEVSKVYREIADSLLGVAQKSGIGSISEDYAMVDSTFMKDGELSWINLIPGGYPGANFLDSAYAHNEGEPFSCVVSLGKGNQAFAIAQVEKFGVKNPKMQIGTIIKNVTPGDKTLEDYMSKANQVAFTLKEGKSIISLRDSLNYVVDSTFVKGSTYSLARIEDSRKIVNWSFDNDLNQPSNVFVTPKSFVVAITTEEIVGKYRPITDQNVNFQVERHARIQKQKAKILETFPTLTADNVGQLPTLVKGGEFKTQNGVQVKTGAREVSGEPKVNGAIAGLSNGKVSDVIEGENGIYVVKVNNESLATITEDTSFDLEKDQIKASVVRNSQLIVDEFVNDKADLQDNRKILR